MPQTFRKCNVCSRELQLSCEFFHRDPKGLAGLCQTCKECARERARKWSAENRERARKAVNDYAARTRFPGSRKDEYEKGREHILEYHHKYYEQNADKIKARGRDYRNENRQAVGERKRLAHIANRESDNARYREWVAANPEKVRACVARMRARRRGAPGNITGKDVAAQYDTQRGTCFYCRKSLAHGSFHVDHYIPLSRGGTNDPSNMVLACPGCNRAKGAKLPDEFLKTRKL